MNMKYLGPAALITLEESLRGDANNRIGAITAIHTAEGLLYQRPYLFGESYDLMKFKPEGEHSILGDSVTVTTIYLQYEGVNGKYPVRTTFTESNSGNYRERHLDVTLIVAGDEVRLQGRVNLDTGAIIVVASTNNLAITPYAYDVMADRVSV